MIEKKLISMLHTLATPEVFFGPQGFKNVVSGDDLAKAQIGFGMNDVGQKITGDDDSTESNTSWQASWQVIARDTELGDPYFVDSAQSELPVYTGFLADEGWEIELVATSLSGYIACMALLCSYGQQSNAQFVPDEKSVVDENVLQLLQEKLIKISGAAQFWQMFMRCYIDWLTEE